MDFDFLREKCGLPFLLKPRRGFGSKGIVVVETAEQFANIVPTTACVTHGRNLLSDAMMRNSRCPRFAMAAGTIRPAWRFGENSPGMGSRKRPRLSMRRNFPKQFGIYAKHSSPIGPTNFQFRKTDRGLKLLEINPRISSSTSIRAAFGYNESLMAVEMALENRMPVQPEIKRGRAVRYTEDFVFYDDSVHF